MCGCGHGVIVCTEVKCKLLHLFKLYLERHYFILGENLPYGWLSDIVTKLFKLFVILCRHSLNYIYYTFIILYIIVVGWDSINIYRFERKKGNEGEKRM